MREGRWEARASAHNMRVASVGEATVGGEGQHASAKLRSGKDGREKTRMQIRME